MAAETRHAEDEAAPRVPDGCRMLGNPYPFQLIQTPGA
jgi:hypothetical protein